MLLPVGRATSSLTDTKAISDATRPLAALIVDDSPSQRRMLKLLLTKWQFEVVEAEDGESALELAKSHHFDFIISDWVMPRMTGPELCRQIRKFQETQYVYFILLTSKTEKKEVATGLDSGADDFLSKPLDTDELEARLRAGSRLLRMRADLVDKNKRVSEAFERLNTLYESVDRDLRAAARLQQSLIPEKQNKCGPIRIGVAYEPCGHVGGDLLGYFRISDDRIAAYSIDVSGHGVSSALLTARLSNFFSSEHLRENIAVRRLSDGSYHPRDPAIIAHDLNERMQDEADNDQYFTMIFADINVSTGFVRFCQAGHPNPAVIRATGEIEFVGDGGPPIGLIKGADYETEVLYLDDGDRMMLFSDGITECEDPSGKLLDEEGLGVLLSRHWGMSEHEVLEHILAEMAVYSGKPDFADDVSALMLTMPVNTERLARRRSGKAAHPRLPQPVLPAPQPG